MWPDSLGDSIVIRKWRQWRDSLDLTLDVAELPKMSSPEHSARAEAFQLRPMYYKQPNFKFRYSTQAGLYTVGSI
ncbi:unnamed protein product [Calypogeia fissa]